MAACYWNQCHCPEAEPCTEHAGFNCGRWQAIVIQDLGQIQDALTRDAEVALVALDADRSRAEDLRRRPSEGPLPTSFKARFRSSRTPTI